MSNITLEVAKTDIGAWCYNKQRILIKATDVYSREMVSMYFQRT